LQFEVWRCNSRIQVCQSVFLCYFPGNFLDQQSASFHQEFPQLASGEEKFEVAKRADKSRDRQHGPGLDPKHQGPSVRFVSFQCCYLGDDACSCFQYTLREILTLKTIQGHLCWTYPHLTVTAITVQCSQSEYFFWKICQGLLSGKILLGLENCLLLTLFLGQRHCLGIDSVSMIRIGCIFWHIVLTYLLLALS